MLPALSPAGCAAALAGWCLCFSCHFVTAVCGVCSFLSVMGGRWHIVEARAVAVSFGSRMLAALRSTWTAPAEQGPCNLDLQHTLQALTACAHSQLLTQMPPPRPPVPAPVAASHSPVAKGASISADFFSAFGSSSRTACRPAASSTRPAASVTRISCCTGSPTIVRG